MEDVIVKIERDYYLEQIKYLDYLKEAFLIDIAVRYDIKGKKYMPLSVKHDKMKSN